MHSGIKFKKALERIEQAEKTIDITKIYFEDISVWPLIRLHIFKSWIASGLQSHPKSKNKIPAPSLSLIKRLWLKVYERIKHLIARQTLIREGKNKIWFLPGVLSHGEDSLDGWYDKFADAYRLISNRKDIFKLTLHGNKGLEGCAFPTSHYSLRHLYYRAYCRYLKNPFRLDDLDGAQEIRSLFDHKENEIEQALGPELFQLLTFAEDFTYLLRKAKPKAIFVICYYSVTNMAIILAAKRLNIPVIDVQHGKQGKYNISYTHFTRMPNNGWNLLPDFFWCWGKQSVINISKHMPPERTTHFPHAIGYMWLALWKFGQPINIPDEHTNFLKEIKHASKRILVTLQPLSDPLHPTLIDAMKEAPTNWLWLIRMHPNMVVTRDEIANRLEQVAKDKFELTFSSNLSLYPLLKASDHHVTAWSSVGYEATEFGIGTTIFDKTGLELYVEEIGSKQFSYADSGNSLLEIIETSNKEELQISPPYIISDLEKLTSSIDTVSRKTPGLQ